MKTLLLTEIFPPKIGGSGRWLWEVYSRLRRDRYVVAAGWDDEHEAFDRTHDLAVYRLPLTLRTWGTFSFGGMKTYAELYFAAREIVRQEQITRLHCGRILPEGWIAWLLKRSSGLPYLCYVHGEELAFDDLGRELTWMVRRVAAGAERFIANSNNTARILGDQWEVPAEKIRVLHPGADVDRFVPAERDTRVRAELGWHDRPVVLTVGRLEKRKGQDRMLDALVSIRRSFPDVLYSIVGDGPQESSLRQQTEQLGLQEHVQFRGKEVDERLLQCFQQCDLFVLPNREVKGDIEGFGMVLVEAQACGKPVIAGDSGGTSETMQVGTTGEIIDCRQPGPLAEAVVRLLEDAPRRRRMGASGRQWASTQFAWDPLARQAEELFDGVPNGAVSF